MAKTVLDRLYIDIYSRQVIITELFYWFINAKMFVLLALLVFSGEAQQQITQPDKNLKEPHNSAEQDKLYAEVLARIQARERDIAEGGSNYEDETEGIDSRFAFFLDHMRLAMVVVISLAGLIILFVMLRIFVFGKANDDGPPIIVK
jgi:hypothetical protein